MSVKKTDDTNNAQATLESFGYKQELKRGLSTWQLAVFGLVFMIPIAPFGIYGFLAETSNNLVPLSYLIATFAMLFTGLSYGSMASAFPISGSVYAYASRGINPHIGFVTGWSILLDYILQPTIIYVVCGAAMHTLFPQVPLFAWSVIFLVFVTAVNFIGIEATAKISIFAMIFELAVFVIFVVVTVIAISHGTNGSHFGVDPIFNTKNFSIVMVMNAVSIAVLSFAGFDAISTLAEESRGGGKSIGKACVGSLLIAGFCFCLITWVGGLLWPDYKLFDSLDSAFYEVANMAGGRALLTLCTIGTSLAWGFAGLTAQAAVSRVLFSMARDGNFPKILAKVHPKFKTPYVATFLVAFIALITSFIFRNGIDSLTSLINFGALTSFFLLHLSVIIHYKVKLKSTNIFKHLVLPLVGAVVIGYIWISLSRDAMILGVIWTSIGIVYYVILKKVYRKNVGDMKL